MKRPGEQYSIYKPRDNDPQHEQKDKDDKKENDKPSDSSKPN